MGHPAPPQQDHTSVCTQGDTQEPPHEKVWERFARWATAAQNLFALALAQQLQYKRAQSLPPPCLHLLQSQSCRQPCSRRLEMRRVTPQHPPSLAELRGHRGTKGHGWQHLIPLTAQSRDLEQTDTILHSHPCNSCFIWDPGGHGHGEITGTSAPWPKGWKGREAAHSCTQDRTWMSPKPGQKQQAGGLLIASRGALVCLSILQQSRFAALIPIWK